MNNLDLYQREDSLSFEQQVHHIIKDIFGEDVSAVCCNNYFILTKPINNSVKLCCVANNGLFSLNKQDYSLLEDDPVLKERALVLGKRNNEGLLTETNDEYDNKMFEFRKQLLLHEQDWIRKYADYIKKFLTSRISEGIPIIQYDAVRLTWADLVERQESLEQVINCFVNASKIIPTEDVLFLAPRIIRESCEILGKLAGGRAFLFGQIIEMLWLFNIINKIYFS